MISIAAIKTELSRWRWYHYFLSILLIVYSISCSKGGDFELFFESAVRFRNRENIYFPLYDGVVTFFYGPVFSMLLSPFTLLPFKLVKFLWVCINIYFLYAIWKMLLSYLDTSAFTSKQFKTFFVVVLVFMLHFINLNLRAGQMTIFMLFLCLKAIVLSGKQKSILASTLLGIGIAIKTMPVIIWAYLIYRGHFRTAIFTILFSILFIFSPCLFSGTDYGLKQISDWLVTINVSGSDYLWREFSCHQHSIHALLFGLLNDANHDLPFNRYFVILPPSQIQVILYFIIGGLIIFTLYFIRTLPFKEAGNKPHQLWEVSYICLLAPLIFPMQQKYSFFFILPAIAYCVHYLVQNRIENFTFIGKKKHYLVFILLCFTLVLSSFSTADVLVGNYIKAFSEYLKFTTYGALFLLIALAICKPFSIHVEPVKAKT